MSINRLQAQPVRKYRTPVMGILFLVAGLAIPGTVKAVETLRVALLPDLPTLTLSAEPGLKISSPGGKRIVRNPLSRIKIRPGTRGLALNGKELPLKDVMITAPGGVIQVNDLTVSGALRVRQTGKLLRVINVIEVEEYLKGVVPVEVSPDWHPELLKVQAIIARTYALYQKLSRQDWNYDVQSGVKDQVYVGRTQNHPAANRAIAETEGRVLTFGGGPILAAYHSTSAGPTENAADVWGIDLPYLEGVSCPFDHDSPHYRWTQVMPMDQVQKGILEAGHAVGTIANITPLRRTRAGRVDQIRILHSKGELILKAEEFRRIMGYSELRSTGFVIEKITDEIRFRGRGFGHAVGLCQWGAKEMADMGYGHERILKHYYPGTTLEPYTSLSLKAQSP